MDMSFVWIEVRPGVPIENLGCDTVHIDKKGTTV